MTTCLIGSAYSGQEFTQIAASPKKYYMRFPRQAERQGRGQG